MFTGDVCLVLKRMMPKCIFCMDDSCFPYRDCFVGQTKSKGHSIAQDKEFCMLHSADTVGLKYILQLA